MDQYRVMSANKSTEFCIVAGAPRSASTSLFSYLADHPGISPSFVKQTGFFIDTEYEDLGSKPLNSFLEGIDVYKTLFGECDNGQIRLEATPDYLYSAGTPVRIAEQLKTTVKIVFVLRNPIDQFCSFYKHYRRLGRISDEVTLEQFAQSALSGSDQQANRVLNKGRYAEYLKPYRDAFDLTQITTILMEDLQQHPQKVLKSLSEQLGIDPQFYNDYIFEKHNASVLTKSSGLLKIYQATRRKGLRVMASSKAVKKLLEPARKIASAVYKAVNTTKVKATVQSPTADHARVQLAEYFAADIRELELMLGMKTNWLDL